MSIGRLWGSKNMKEKEKKIWFFFSPPWFIPFRMYELLTEKEGNDILWLLDAVLPSTISKIDALDWEIME